MLNLKIKNTQQKRVPVIIRYSAESGLKPYYLTVAKRVKDMYPDVLLERVVTTGSSSDGADNNDGKGGDSKKNYNMGAIGPSASFEVVVDGKVVVRTQRTQTGSVFVSMAEMDIAILRARKRRRPSTVYGENGAKSAVGIYV